MEETEDYLEQLKNHRARSARKRRLSENPLTTDGNPSGNAYYGSRHDLTVAHAGSLSKKARLDIHAHLAKAESALPAQIRTEKIDLAHFPHQRSRSSNDLPGYGIHRTTRHVLQPYEPHRESALLEQLQGRHKPITQNKTKYQAPKRACHQVDLRPNSGLQSQVFAGPTKAQ